MVRVCASHFFGTGGGLDCFEFLVLAIGRPFFCVLKIFQWLFNLLVLALHCFPLIHNLFHFSFVVEHILFGMNRAVLKSNLLRCSRACECLFLAPLFAPLDKP